MSGPQQVGDLFISLELRTQQLEQQAKRAEDALGGIADKGKEAAGGAKEAEEGLGGVGTSATRLASRINPVTAGLAVLGATLVVVAKNANDAALSMEGAVKSLTTAAPRLQGSVGALRDTLNAVAVATGRTVTELGEVGQSSARAAGSVEDLGNRLKLASDLAKATGQDFGDTADGINQILGVFGLLGEQAEPVANQLFRLASTGVELDKLFAALRSAAPTIRETGVSFETATAALASFIREGLTGPQAAAELKKLAQGGEEGAAALRKIAAESPGAAEGLKSVAEAAALIDPAATRADKALAQIAANLTPLGRAIRTFTSEAKASLTEVIALATTPALLRYLRAGAGPAATVSTALPIIVTPNASQLAGSGSTPERPLRDTAAAARDAQKALGDLGNILDRLNEDIFDTAAQKIQRAREEIEALAAAAGGDKAAQLAALAQQLLTVNEALDGFNPSVRFGSGNVDPLGLKGIDFEEQANFVARLRRETEGFFDAAGEQTQDNLDNAVRDTLQQASLIRDSVRGALELGEAFGVVDDELANILNSLASVATGIGPLVKALQSGAGLGTIVGAALPVIGGISGLVSGLFGGGESESQRKLREAIEANREALEENSRRLDELSQRGLIGSGLTGDQINTARGLRSIPLTNDPFNGGGPITIDFGAAPNTVNISEELNRLGISMADLEELAGALGLEFVELTSGNVDQFLQFLDDVNTLLDQGLFGTGLNSRLDLTRVGFDFAEDAPSGGERFTALFDSATIGEGASDLLKNAFEGIDFSTIDLPETQEAIRQIIRDLFGTVTGEGFDFAGLGDFTGEEFIGFLLELLGLLPEGADGVEDFGDAVKTAAEKFSEAVGALNLTTRVFDLSTIEQAQAFLGILGEFSPAFADLISEFDLTTVEGINGATAVLQDYFLAIQSGEVSLEGLGFTIEDVAAAIDLLQGASAEAIREIERQAAEEKRQADEERRANDAAYRESQRQAEEEQRAAERAHQEELRRIEEIRRARLDVGQDTLRALQEQFQLFDVDDIAAQLSARIQTLSAQSPAFAELFQGIDANDAGSRAEALARLREFALANPFGLESGDLSADVTRSEVLSIAELIKALNEVTITTTEDRNESFRVDRTITQVEGERISGLLGTGNILAEESLAVQRAMLSLWQAALGFEGLSAPAVPGAAGPTFGTAAIYLTVNINGTEVSGGLSGATAQNVVAFGQALADELLLADMGA